MDNNYQFCFKAITRHGRSDLNSAGINTTVITTVVSLTIRAVAKL
jgi:hypothetical protein